MNPCFGSITLATSRQNDKGREMNLGFRRNDKREDGFPPEFIPVKAGTGMTRGAEAVDKEPLVPVSFLCSLRWVLPVFLYINANHSTTGKKKKEIGEGEDQGAGVVLLFQYHKEQAG
jgi:hypothetical protein